MIPDPIPSHLDIIRSLYVATFAEVIREREGHVEPVFRTDDGDVAVEGELELPCRADFIDPEANEGGESLMVDSARLASFEPLAVEIGGTKLHVAPFGWDWATLSVLGLDDEDASDLLVKWFWDWFDADDTNEETAEGLYGVVHFLSDPEPVEGGLRVNLDLGSAPAEAMTDLLSRLIESEAREVHVA
jgi:hypothetical protein